MGEVHISRRTMLALTGSAAVSAVVPSMAVATTMPVKSGSGIAWLVGTPGEFDYQHIVAQTAEEARRRWVNDRIGGSGCEVIEEIASAGGLEAYLADGGEPPAVYCDCEWCNAFHGCDANRIPVWDGRAEGSPTHADWLREGMGTFCDRCSYECFEAEGTGFAVGDKAVCEDCMTLADWRIVDPKRAAELEAEEAEDAEPAPAEATGEGEEP